MKKKIGFQTPQSWFKRNFRLIFYLALAVFFLIFLTARASAAGEEILTSNYGGCDTGTNNFYMSYAPTSSFPIKITTIKIQFKSNSGAGAADFNWQLNQQNIKSSGQYWSGGPGTSNWDISDENWIITDLNQIDRFQMYSNTSFACNQTGGIFEIYGIKNFGTSNISFAYPTGTSTIPDFISWSFNYSASTTPAAISVYYWDENETQLFNDVFLTNFATGTARHFTKQNALSLGGWSAYATLFGIDSGTINFNVVSTSSFISYLTASSTCAGYGYFGEPLCLLAFQLFIPSPSSLNQFTTSSNGSDLVSLATSKAPFSYIFQTIDVLGNFNASTTPTSSLAAIYSIGSALNGLNLNWVLATLLWILLAFWLFHRARNLEI